MALTCWWWGAAEFCCSRAPRRTAQVFFHVVEKLRLGSRSCCDGLRSFPGLKLLSSRAPFDCPRVSRSFLCLPVFSSTSCPPPRSPVILRRPSLLFLPYRTWCSTFTRRPAKFPKSVLRTYTTTDGNESLFISIVPCDAARLP